jgi:hypothetical protein
MGFFADLWKSFQSHTPSQKFPNHNPRDYPVRDPNRKLTKRMEIRYNQLIAKLGPLSSIDEGLEKLDKFIHPRHAKHSRNFFTHPYVQKTLKFSDSPELVNESVGEWWKVGKSEDKSAIPWSSIPVSENVDICGDPSCSSGVNAFDFRCFTCRKRYCDTHKGTGIDCKSCESLS